MFLDIFSPQDLTSFAFAKGLDGLIAFAGFILLFGSILGIIIDGIHHSIVEDHIFDVDEEIKYRKFNYKYCILEYWLNINNKKIRFDDLDNSNLYILLEKLFEISPRSKDFRISIPTPNGNLLSDFKEFINMADSANNPKEICKGCEFNPIYCSSLNVCPICPIEKSTLNRFYLYKEFSDKFIQINDYLIENWYAYSEFYSNTFLSLIPFIFVAPTYCYLVLQTSVSFSIYFMIIVGLCALACFYSSFVAYREYMKGVNAVLQGYVDSTSKKEDVKKSESLTTSETCAINELIKLMKSESARKG